jgi:hypothetical protein
MTDTIHFTSLEQPVAFSVKGRCSAQVVYNLYKSSTPKFFYKKKNKQTGGM